MQPVTALQLSNVFTSSVVISTGVVYIVCHLLASVPDCVNSENAYAIYTEYRQKDAVTLTIATNVVLSRIWIALETKWILDYESDLSVGVGKIYKEWCLFDRSSWMWGCIVVGVITDAFNLALFTSRDSQCDSTNKSKLQTLSIWCARETHNDVLSLLFVLFPLAMLVIHVMFYVRYVVHKIAK